jgi:hypothetical protein
VTTVEAFWLYNLRARIVRFGTKRAEEAVWLLKLRRVRALILRFGRHRANKRNNRIRGANGNVSQAAILRGSFTATICCEARSGARHRKAV